MTIEQIIESYKNGQYKKMIEQAKVYGKHKAIIDIYQSDMLFPNDKLEIIYFISTR